MRVALISAAMAALATQVSAAEWWLVATTADRRAVYVDRQSIVDASTAARRMSAVSGQVIRPESQSGGAIAFTAYFQCNGRYSGIASQVYRDPAGRAPSQGSHEAMAARLAPARPGSGDAEVVLFGCNEGKIIEGESQFSFAGVDFFEVKDPASSTSAYLSR